MKSRKVFKLFYHRERVTGVLSELFKIAMRNSVMLWRVNEDIAPY